MTGQQLRHALKSGRRVYGSCILSTSPLWPAAVRSTGVDFVFIDTEHSPNDRAIVSWMCQQYRSMDIAPMVRIPSPDPFEACKMLDGGAAAVLAPYIESPEQVRQLVGAVKLRPLKGGRMQRALVDPSSLEPELARYLEDRNSGNSLLINIESVPALQILDDIVSVPGVDAVQVGPHDLSCSLGVPEQYHHPKFEAAIEHIITTSRRHGVGVGIHEFWDDLDQAIRWGKMGANLIMHSVDQTLFSRTLRDRLNHFRTAFADEPARDGGPEAVI